MANVIPGGNQKFFKTPILNWFESAANNLLKASQGPVKSIIGSAGPKEIPLGSTALTATQRYTEEALVFRAGYTILALFGSIFVAIFAVSLLTGSRVLKKFVKFLNLFFSRFTTIDPPKYSDSKWKIVRMLYRVIHWPYYLLVVVCSTIKALFTWSNLILIFIMVLLVGTLLQFEVYQNEILDYIDYLLIIGRHGINIVTAAINTIGQTVGVFFVPIANGIIGFVVQCFLITKDYIVPIYLKAVEENNASQGRRSLKASEIPYFGKEYFMILEASGAIFLGLINILLSFWLAAWSFLNWIFFAAFGDSIGDILVVLVNFAKGWFCYLVPDYLFCTLAQFVQYIVIFIEVILNALLSLIFAVIPFGIGAPQISLDFFNIQCQEARTVSGTTVPPEDCIRCRPAFPGWINSCPDEKARRLLKIECNDFTQINGTWSEKVFWDGVLIQTPSYYNFTSNWKGCPLSKNGMLKNDIGMHYKYSGHYEDCYDIMVGDKMTIQCPETPKFSFEDGRRRLRSERNLGSLLDDLNEQKKEYVKKEGYALLTRETFSVAYAKIIESTNKAKDSSVFDCSDHNPHNNSHVFDTFCSIQALVSRKEIGEEVSNRYNPTRHLHENNVYAKYRNRVGNKKEGHFTKRQLHEHYNTVNYVHEKYKQFENAFSRRRRLKAKEQIVQLVNVTAADGTCPLGYVKCPASPYCEIYLACKCPDQMQPFNSLHEESDYSYYKTMCALKNANPSDWVTSTIQCWDRYRTKDTSSPFAAAGATVVNSINAFARQADNLQNIEYCFPLIDPSSFLIPEIEEGFSLRNYYATKYCKDTKANFIVSDCMCPGYDNGVDAKNGWFINGVGYYMRARLYNGWKVYRDVPFAGLNSLTLGAWNYIWSGFWRPTNAQPFWTEAFDETFSLGNLGCAGFHLGSWAFFNLIFFFLAILFFGCAFTAAWYFALDLPYVFIMVPFGLDQTVNYFNAKHSDQAEALKVFSEQQKIEDDVESEKSLTQKKLY